MIDAETLRLVAQFLNHYAIPGPEQLQYFQKYFRMLSHIRANQRLQASGAPFAAVSVGTRLIPKSVVNIFFT